MKTGNTLDIVRRATAIAFLFALAATLRAGADQSENRAEYQVEIVGTAFRLTFPDGRQVRGDELIGMILTLGDPGDARRSIRIDAVQPDPKDPEITLYTLSVLDPVSGAWQNPYPPDAEGLTMGFPLSGTWTAAGEHVPSDHAFSITCTRGVNAKCVRMGYKPWKPHKGKSLWKLRRNCSRGWPDGARGPKNFAH